MLEFDVIVAGAGVIGLSVAWRLAELGAKVVVLDPDQKGGRGSRAAAEWLFHLCVLVLIDL